LADTLPNNDAERTLPATERRRRAARAQGDVVRSGDLTAALILLAASLAFVVLAPGWLSDLTTELRRATTSAGSLSNGPTDLIMASGRLIVAILIPFAAIIFAAGIIANLLQTGFMWTPSRVVSGLKVNRPVTQSRLLVGLFVVMRLCVASGIIWWFISSQLQRFQEIGLRNPRSIVIDASQIILELFVQLTIGLIVVAIAEYGIRYWLFERRLRMTSEELRREQLEDQIDPRFRRLGSPRYETRTQPESISPIGHDS
jgi:flagellar biosynthesis protein FlhB